MSDISLFDPHWETDLLIMEHASLAVDAVHNGLKLDLDLTSDTLSILDYYVSTIGVVDDAIYELVSVTTGAYFGELLRRAMGGEWYLPDKEDPYSWALRFHTCPIAIYPVAVALDVITKGELDAGFAFLAVTPSRHALLEEMLDHAPQQTEDEYYSFAGRMDAMQLCVSFLSDVEQQVADKIKKPPPQFGSEDPLTLHLTPLSVMDPKEEEA